MVVAIIVCCQGLLHKMRLGIISARCHADQGTVRYSQCLRRQIVAILLSDDVDNLKCLTDDEEEGSGYVSEAGRHTRHNHERLE